MTIISIYDQWDPMTCRIKLSISIQLICIPDDDPKAPAPPPIKGLLSVGGVAESTFFMSRLTGDPMTPPTILPASTKDIWMMMIIL